VCAIIPFPKPVSPFLDTFLHRERRIPLPHGQIAPQILLSLCAPWVIEIEYPESTSSEKTPFPPPPSFINCFFVTPLPFPPYTSIPRIFLPRIVFFFPPPSLLRFPPPPPQPSIFTPHKKIHNSCPPSSPKRTWARSLHSTPSSIQ